MRDGFPEEVPLGQRYEGSEGEDHVDVQGKGYWTKRKRTVKGREVGISFAFRAQREGG